MEDERLILWIFYLALLGIAGFIMISYVNDAASDTIFKQKVLASNLALIHDSLGDEIYFKYEIKGDYETIKFDTVDGCKVIVKHRDLKTGEEFICTKLDFDNNEITVLNDPKYIIFEIINGKLLISKV